MSHIIGIEGASSTRLLTCKIFLKKAMPEHQPEDYIDLIIITKVETVSEHLFTLTDAEHKALTQCEALRSARGRFGVFKAVDRDHFKALSDNGMGTIVVSQRIEIALPNDTPTAKHRANVILAGWLGKSDCNAESLS